jgi:hypothetical protein
MWPKTSDLIGKFITNKYAFLDSPHNNLQSEVIITQYIVGVFKTFFEQIYNKRFKNISITFSMSVYMQKLLNHGASYHEIWHWGLKHVMLTGAVWLKLHNTIQHNNFTLRPTNIPSATHLTPIRAKTAMIKSHKEKWNAYILCRLPFLCSLMGI